MKREKREEKAKRNSERSLSVPAYVRRKNLHELTGEGGRKRFWRRLTDEAKAVRKEKKVREKPSSQGATICSAPGTPVHPVHLSPIDLVHVGTSRSCCGRGEKRSG